MNCLYCILYKTGRFLQYKLTNKCGKVSVPFMRTKVPHNVLTISEMTRRPNRIKNEVIALDNLVLTEEVIKKLRASSSMFNKTTYIQILHDGVKYNIENVDKQKSGKYKISLISTFAYMTLMGTINSNVDLIKFNML